MIAFRKKRAHTALLLCVPHTNHRLDQSRRIAHAMHVCDGTPQCPLGSDEYNCDNKNDTCGENEFQCVSDKKCISYDLVCDKTPHCSDNSDEPLHCGKNECARVEDNGCGHNCIDTKEGFKCYCNPGYKLMDDGKACQDIDECAGAANSCHSNATCVNTEGAYTCICQTGYAGNGTDCYGENLMSILCKINV